MLYMRQARNSAIGGQRVMRCRKVMDAEMAETGSCADQGDEAARSRQTQKVLRIHIGTRTLFSSDSMRE